MNNNALLNHFTLLILVIFFLTSCNMNKRQCYEKYEKDLVNKRDQIRNLDNKIDTKLINDTREFIFTKVIEDLIPAWYGTQWSYNGNSKIPGEGTIACGYFIIRILQDAGFIIPTEMAQQPSEYIIKNICGTKKILKFNNFAAMENIINSITQNGEGIYIVGMDKHVGFVIYYDDKVSFCHSSHYSSPNAGPPLGVVNQEITERSPLTDSEYRVVSKLLDDKMILRWINGERFEIIYDYFQNDYVSNQ